MNKKKHFEDLKRAIELVEKEVLLGKKSKPMTQFDEISAEYGEEAALLFADPPASKRSYLDSIAMLEAFSKKQKFDKKDLYATPYREETKEKRTYSCDSFHIIKERPEGIGIVVKENG